MSAQDQSRDAAIYMRFFGRLFTEPTPDLDLGGQYHFRAQGERHLWDPNTVSKLQHAVRMDDGTFAHFEGYRVHHSLARGPGKGGIRYHPQVSLAEVMALHDGGPAGSVQDVIEADAASRRLVARLLSSAARAEAVPR